MGGGYKRPPSAWSTLGCGTPLHMGRLRRWCEERAVGDRGPGHWRKLAMPFTFFKKAQEKYDALGSYLGSVVLYGSQKKIEMCLALYSHIVWRFTGSWVLSVPWLARQIVKLSFLPETRNSKAFASIKIPKLGARKLTINLSKKTYGYISLKGKKGIKIK